MEAGSDAGTPRRAARAGATPPATNRAARAGAASGATPPGAGLLAGLSLVWLAAMLWSTHAAIRAAATGAVATTAAAYALPAVISASLLGGVTTGLLAVGLLARRTADREPRPGPRFAVAVGAGLIVGLVAAVITALTNDGDSAPLVIAGGIAAAATLGGALAGIRATAVLAAATAGSLAVSATGLVLNLLRQPLLAAYGWGDRESQQLSALGWYAFTVSITSGLAAGLIGFWYLRRASRRAGTTPSWPTYLCAGAGAGLVLLLAELITRTGGARLLAEAGALSPADRAVQSLLSGSRINHALVVLFVGAISAMIAFGRTLKPAARA